LGLVEIFATTTSPGVEFSLVDVSAVCSVQLSGVQFSSSSVELS